MYVHTVQTTRVEVSNGDRDTSPHEHRKVADLRKIPLPAETIRRIRLRAIRCQIELEVVVHTAEAFDDCQPFNLGVCKLDLVQLILRVGRIRPGEVCYRRRVRQRAIVRILWLRALSLSERWTKRNGSSGPDKACSKVEDFGEHLDVEVKLSDRSHELDQFTVGGTLQDGGREEHMGSIYV